MSRKALKTIVQMIVFASIGGGIIWYMMDNMEKDEIVKLTAAIGRTNLWILVPVFVVAFISHWSRAKRWQLLMEPLGLKPSTPNTLMSVLIGYVINLVPPRAGEVAKCTILARYEKVPPNKMIGTIVAERVWDVLCLLIVITAGLFWQKAALGDYLQKELKGRTPSVQGVAITVGVIAVIAILLRLYYRRNRESRVGRFIGGLGEGIGSIMHLRHRGLFMLHTLIIWSAYLAQIRLAFLCMPPTLHLGWGPAMLTLVFGSLAMIAAPGGFGLYPIMIGSVLEHGYGLSAEDGLAFGLVSWLGQTGITLFLGLLSFIFLPIYNRKPHNAQERLDHPKDI